MRSCLVAVACVWLAQSGCDDGPSGTRRDATLVDGAADARSVDAASLDGGGPDATDLDARRPDAAPADGDLPDVAARDGGDLDARLPDVPAPDTGGRDAAGVDAAGMDARPRDGGGLPDASAPGDAGQVDADADAGPADAAVDALVRDAAIPDVGADAAPENLEAACNYRDDDGDGRVDEGYRYEFLGEPVRLLPEPEQNPSGLSIVWDGNGFGFAWKANGRANFMRLDPSGRPASEVRRLGQALFGSVDLAYLDGTYAVTFSWNQVTSVQLIDGDGQPIGEPVSMDPRRPVGIETVLAAGNGVFGAFSYAAPLMRPGPPSSAFLELDREGNIVNGPAETYRFDDGGFAVNDIAGMAFDGEAYGLAWFSSTGARGNEIAFMRWAPDGRILVHPTVLGRGDVGRAGIAWTGTHFVVPFAGRSNYLAFVDRDGRVDELIDLGMSEFPDVRLLAWSGDQLLVHTTGPETRYIARLDGHGQRLGPDTPDRRGIPIPAAIAARTDGPSGTVTWILNDERRFDAFLQFIAFGCREEDE